MTDLARAQSTFLTESELIERIFEHVDRGTTDMSQASWREPVANYLSTDRLQREVETVLRRLPVPFCPSAALAAPGSYVARDAAGVALVAVRDLDGRVHAFRNSCRHRGTALVSDAGTARSFVCPYHGWVYRLDGALRHVPDEHGFPGLDKASRGLVPVDVAEHGGLVYISQDGEIDADALAAAPTVIDDDHVLFDSTEAIMDVNWKVFTEGFLEGYHIKATHPETFFPFGYDNVNVVESHGRYSRVTFPFRRIESVRDLAPDQRRIDGLATTVDHVFPNVVVARLSHHTTVAVLEPLALDRTRLVSYRLTNRRRGEVGAESAARDTDFVSRGAAEDLAIARKVQRGLASGANEFLEFGRFEGAIAHFHRQLSDLLDVAPLAVRRTGGG